MCFVLTSDEKEERVYGFEHRLQLRSATKALITDEKNLSITISIDVNVLSFRRHNTFSKEVILQPEYELPLNINEKETQCKNGHLR